MAMKRRENNAGALSQRTDGRWQASVIVAYDPATGKPKRRYFIGKDKKQVVERLQKAVKARSEGRPVPLEKETVKGYLTRWLTDVAKPSVRVSTWTGYEVIIRRHLVPRIGHVRLARLKPEEIAKCYRELLDSGLSARTTQLAHAVLHRALEHAVRWELISRSPAGLVDAPRVERKELAILNPADCQRFLQAAREDRWSALYHVALLGGLRMGETLGLRWSDIDWEHGIVQVKRQLTRVSGEGFVTSEPKTRRGQRSVTLPAVAMASLREHRAHQAEIRLRAGAAWRENGWVFCNQIGKPVERGNIQRRSFKPLLSRLGLPESLRLHDLRHASATLLLWLGEHPKVVQERLGHATISLTLDTYSHVVPQMQQAAAAKLDAWAI